MAGLNPELDPSGLRSAMAWLHTWSGLLPGWVLYAMFLTGTLAFFQLEITQWMRPEEHRMQASPQRALEVAEQNLRAHGQNARRWFIDMPSHREAAVEISQAGARASGVRLNPATGAAWASRDTRGGEFFYRFHYDLELRNPWGRWIASLAAMLMLVAIISGVIRHRRIFKDFFTFRPGRRGARSWMDGHTLVSVLALPFHVMITFSGLALFVVILVPSAIHAAYPGTGEFVDEVFTGYVMKARSGQPATLAPLTPMLDKAREYWPDGRIARIIVNHPGDAAATVSMLRAAGDRLTYGHVPPSIQFDGVTGRVLAVFDGDHAAVRVLGALGGLHLGRFADAPLRWVYFVLGLLGTAMVGTGLVLWAARRRKHAHDAGQSWGQTLVERLNVATIAGLCVAVACYFLANRLLDARWDARRDWEVRAFFSVWMAAYAHAWLRTPAQAWVEQWALASLAFAAIPAANALTSGRHVAAALSDGDWVFAGFDLSAVVASIAFGWIAARVRRNSLPGRQPEPGRGRETPVRGRAT